MLFYLLIDVYVPKRMATFREKNEVQGLEVEAAWA